MIKNILIKFEEKIVKSFNTLYNSFKHLKKIIQHKYWVFVYCSKCGIIWRGIKHDLSKFSITEFFESVKYYKGTSSPIDECKKINGVSYAWMHHKGRNDHHYEYWVDNLDNGGTPTRMPYKCAVEMLCDFLAASRAYNGKSFTYEGTLQWWLNKLNSNPAIHYSTQYFISSILFDLFGEELRNVDDIIKMVLCPSNLRIQYIHSTHITEEQNKGFIELIKFQIKRKIV